ncbi:DUF3558 domain-containing protein [Amycolatopsis sp. NPDC051373]|uniref:DUF3558 domain-containing protein n=1 Tax=Amycolatopsis sp. NPDC051373 TaxID=3155801 RepID=UPI00344E9A9B
MQRTRQTCRPHHHSERLRSAGPQAPPDRQLAQRSAQRPLRCRSRPSRPRLPGRLVKETLTSCAWTSSGSKQNFVHITALPQNDHGISDLYNLKSNQAYFEPTWIAGYPALYADTQDGRNDGTCTLWVGITDKLAASVLPQIGMGRTRDNPCGVAQQVATVVINHLKPNPDRPEPQVQATTRSISTCARTRLNPSGNQRPCVTIQPADLAVWGARGSPRG